MLMIENTLTGLPWEITKRVPHVAEVLRRAGFRAWPEGSDVGVKGSPSFPSRCFT